MVMPCLASPLQVLAGLGSAASPLLSFCSSAGGAVTHSKGQVAAVLSLWSTAPPEGHFLLQSRAALQWSQMVWISAALECSSGWSSQPLKIRIVAIW